MTYGAQFSSVSQNAISISPPPSFHHATAACRLLIRHLHLPEVLFRIDILLSGRRCRYSIDLRCRRRADVHCISGENSFYTNEQQSPAAYRMIRSWKFQAPEIQSCIRGVVGRETGRKRSPHRNRPTQAGGKRQRRIAADAPHTVGLCSLLFLFTLLFSLLYSRFTHCVPPPRERLPKSPVRPATRVRRRRRR